MKSVLVLWVLTTFIQTYAVDLYNSDFAQGTYQIMKPGVYVLQEDIVFNPHPPANDDEILTCCTVKEEQFFSNGGEYDDTGFHMGFFAAIAISANGVELDLNGHSIEQSPQHALMQRFFAVIELADQPFIPGQGPHDFGCFQAGKNIYIHDGTIGRSSHHGIHGNGNEYVQIDNVNFDGFEVAAIHLNGGYQIELSNIIATNRKDIPVVGTFSSVIFIQPFLNHLLEIGSNTTLRVQGVELTVQDIHDTIEEHVINTFNDVVATGNINPITHPNEYALFHNPTGILDGNAYGIVTNKLGVAINGFPFTPSEPYASIQPSRYVTITNVTVYDLRASVNEIVAIHDTGAVIDPAGSVFQIWNMHPDDGVTPVTISSADESMAEYIGNAAANAQAIVGKAIIMGDFEGSHLHTMRNKISQTILDWIEAGGDAVPEAKLSHLSSELGYLCNGDSMFHVNKGVIGFKIDATDYFTLSNCHVSGIENIGKAGSPLCGNYTKSHPAASLEGYGGAHTRGYTFAGSNQGTLEYSTVSDIHSVNGPVVGFDVFTDSSRVLLRHSDMFMAESDNDDVVGYHFGALTSRNTVKKWCVAFTESPNGQTLETVNEGTNNNVKPEEC